MPLCWENQVEITKSLPCMRCHSNYISHVDRTDCRIVLNLPSDSDSFARDTILHAFPFCQRTSLSDLNVDARVTNHSHNLELSPCSQSWIWSGCFIFILLWHFSRT